MALECHAVAPTSEHTHTIVFLHGRDSEAEEFASELFESQDSKGLTLPEILPFVRWVFPSSGRKKARRFDCDMSQWFDMMSLEEPDFELDDQLPELQESIRLINALLHEEAKTVPTQKIFLAGISQGCATAIHALFHQDEQLGGFIGLSSWLPRASRMTSRARNTDEPREKLWHARVQVWRGKTKQPETAHCLRTPVFLGHCQDDDVIRIEEGRAMCTALVELNMSVEWKPYEKGGHWLNEPKGIDDITRFLARHMDLEGMEGGEESGGSLILRT